MTWPEYLLAVIAWQSEQEDEKDSDETVSGSEAMERIRRARDSVTSTK